MNIAYYVRVLNKEWCAFTYQKKKTNDIDLLGLREAYTLFTNIFFTVVLLSLFQMVIREFFWTKSTKTYSFIITLYENPSKSSATFCMTLSHFAGPSHWQQYDIALECYVNPIQTSYLYCYKSTVSDTQDCNINMLCVCLYQITTRMQKALLYFNTKCRTFIKINKAEKR